jgi:NADH-quinone oxidoreductase subunit N
MLSLLGFPGTLGFIGKWAILSALVEVKHLPLAVILVLTSLVSAGYYLPVLMSAYMREPVPSQTPGGGMLPAPAALAVGAAVVVVLVLGVLPAPVLDRAVETAGTLIRGVSMVTSGASP